jgi:CO dehydrogenase/acetyl-CoA synthase gamma subunit (corrinoid Fe-S protein)
MAVEQEMAEIHPPQPEELCQFLPETDCGKCGFASCDEFAAAVLKKETDPHECSDLDHDFADVLGAILDLNTDPIPYNIMMEQAPCELIKINSPDESSPLLITCNFSETVRIMQEILESTGVRAFLLPTFTHGYSVDNAVHERMFKAMEVWKAIKENRVEEQLAKPILIIPGIADTERNAIRQISKWDVRVGPESGFLVPLFILQNQEAFLY